MMEGIIEFHDVTRQDKTTQENPMKSIKKPAQSIITVTINKQQTTIFILHKKKL